MWKIVFSLVLSLTFAIALHSQASIPPTTTQEAEYNETRYIPAEFAIIETEEESEESEAIFGDGAHKRFKIAVEGNLIRKD